MTVKKKVIKYVRKPSKARASTAVMIKRYASKLAKLKEVQRLQAIKKEVDDLQRLIKQGY